MEPLYKGQVGDGSFVPYTVEPLYKGQVGDGPYTVEPLYKGQIWLYSGASLQGTSWGWAFYSGASQVGGGPSTVEPLYKGQVRDGFGERLPSSRGDILSLWEVEILRITTCPLFRGGPLFRRYTIILEVRLYI